MQIIVTVETPDHLDRPGISIAQTMREAAAVLEMQVPLADHFHIYDRFGVQKCEWQIAEVTPA